MNKYLENNIINYLKTYLDNVTRRQNEYFHFLFLCGKELKDGEEKLLTNRGVIEEFLNSKDNNIIPIYSEKLFNPNSEIDLLSFEELLFELCDYLIIIVESYGSICELGAFSNIEKSKFKKIIVINDISKKNEKSFINNGPIKKIENNEGKVIYSKLENASVLTNKDVLDELYKISEESKIKKYKSINRNENKIEVNSFIFEIIELVYLLQPIDQDTLISIYKEIKGFKWFSFKSKTENRCVKDMPVSRIFELLVNIDLLSFDNNLYRIGNKVQKGTFMFRYSEYTKNRIRSRLLCDRYKNGEKSCIRK